jgi:Type I restriction enzyme R protein N terminus (HSDR_N)
MRRTIVASSGTIWSTPATEWYPYGRGPPWYRPFSARAFAVAATRSPIRLRSNCPNTAVTPAIASPSGVERSMCAVSDSTRTSAATRRLTSFANNSTSRASRSCAHTTITSSSSSRPSISWRPGRSSRAPEIPGSLYVLQEAYHSWTPGEEVARYPIKGTYDAGISLRDVVIWDKPIPLQNIWSALAAAKKNPTAHFMQTTYPLLDDDGIKLVEAGRRGTAPPGASAPITFSEGTGAALGGDPQAARFFAVVRELRELDSGTKINEVTTCAVFLNRYFEALGYSALQDIAYGEPAQSGNFPDYVLKVNGKPVIAVEAKALGFNMGDKEAGQVTGYCGTLAVRWGLLTDGRFFKLYDAHASGNPDDRLVFTLDLTDYRSEEDFSISIWDTVQMLSRQQMQTGHVLERYAARELARRILNDKDSATLAALSDELAGQKVNLTSAEVQALVEELIGS